MSPDVSTSMDQAPRPAIRQGSAGVAQAREGGTRRSRRLRSEERMNRRRREKALRRKSKLRARALGLEAPSANAQFLATPDFVDVEDIRVVVPPDAVLRAGSGETDPERRLRIRRKAMKSFLREALGPSYAARMMSPDRSPRAARARPGLGDRGDIRGLDAIGLLLFHGPGPSEVKRLEQAGAALFPNIEVEAAVGDPTRGGSGTPRHLHLDGVAELRASGLDGRGIVIGIADSGVDGEHPEFAGRIDDYAEFSRDGAPDPIRRGPAKDRHGHGTHIASMAAGARVGVAPGARLRVAAVLTAIGETGAPKGRLVQILAGVQWLLRPVGGRGAGCDVLNLSLGYDAPDRRLAGVLETALDVGVVTVAAVGNVKRGGRAGPAHPGALDETLAAGACDGRGAPWSGNRSGPSAGPAGRPKPDVLAPGVDVTGAWPGGGYRAATGSSVAAGIVSGALALKLQQDRYFFDVATGGGIAAVVAEVQRLVAPVAAGGGVVAQPPNAPGP